MNFTESYHLDDQFHFFLNAVTHLYISFQILCIRNHSCTLFTILGKELPYCCEVRIDEFKEPNQSDKRPLTRIKASIHVERDSQKGIVVGKGGAMIKDVGVQAREKVEEFLQEKVFLNLEVKVDKNWRKDEKKLKAYGYLK